jgi:tRNA (guanine37-N1)-methyltransferase
MLRFDVLTLFAPMFEAIGRQGITARALERGLWSMHCWNPRDYAADPYRSIDDRAYGGGPGMVMMVAPLRAALQAVAASRCDEGRDPQASRTIVLSPRGRPLTHQRVVQLSAYASITLVCGRYEGIDQRFIDGWVDEEISVGDFVVSGGELPAMMLMDALIRLLPGAVNDAASVQQESFATGLLDCPHYTRPERFESVDVPEVLLSGHHARIARWRREQALLLTHTRRPDLIETARSQGLLDADDERFLKACGTSAASDAPIAVAKSGLGDSKGSSRPV